MAPRKRQAPHLGHEYQLPSGAWAIRVSLGGRRHFVSGRTRTEAREQRDALLQRHRSGGLATDPRAGREPVLARLRSWLAGKQAEVEPSTWLRYRLAVEGHLRPLLGAVTLRHISDDPAALRALYAALGARLSAKSVREAHLVLRHTYASALLAAGRPITEVAMLMGHGSPATTMAIYAHWIRQDAGAAAEALSRFYGR